MHYLHQKAVEHYGLPEVREGGIAAHGPTAPGQIKGKRYGKDKGKE